MQYLISIAAGLAGGIAAVLLFGRRRSRRRTDSKNAVSYTHLTLPTT